MEKEQVLEKLKEIALNRLDVVGAVSDVLAEILEPALKALVEKTDNPYDDAAMMALYPVLKQILEEKLKELADKLKQPEVPAV